MVNIVLVKNNMKQICFVKIYFYLCTKDISDDTKRSIFIIDNATPLV